MNSHFDSLTYMPCLSSRVNNFIQYLQVFMTIRSDNDAINRTMHIVIPFIIWSMVDWKSGEAEAIP